MLAPNRLRVAANDEYGMEPPTPGKQTPPLPYVGRPLYANEFTRPVKYRFLAACARCGFDVADLHAPICDVPVPERVELLPAIRPAVLVTFSLDATATEAGVSVGFSSRSPVALRSQRCAALVDRAIGRLGILPDLGAGDRDHPILNSAVTPSVRVRTAFGPDSVARAADPEWQTMIAEAAAIGVCRFCDVKYIPAAPQSRYPSISAGAEGCPVFFLQSSLCALGLNNVPIDGVFGGLTDRAVRLFQQQNKLPVNGVFGRDCWKTLLTDYTKAPTLRTGSAGVFVRYMQGKLLSKLFGPDAVNGIFSLETENAVRSFQAEHNLPATGVVDAPTWERIASFECLPNPDRADRIPLRS